MVALAHKMTSSSVSYVMMGMTGQKISVFITGISSVTSVKIVMGINGHEVLSKFPSSILVAHMDTDWLMAD